MSKTTFKQKIMLIAFGSFLCVITLEIGLRIGGFIILSMQEYRNKISVKQNGTYRIMCLGESTTAGQYPFFLEKILNQQNTDIKFSVIDKGVAGTYSCDILNRLEFALDEYLPDMVITMMGINDNNLESYVPHKIGLNLKIMFFLKNCRVNKLAKLFLLHIDAKTKETGLKEKILKKSIELNSSNDRTYNDLGAAYYNQDKLLQAEEVLKKSIALNPKNDQAHAILGNCYKKQERFKEAEAELKKAIELNPNNFCVYSNLGWTYILERKFPQAEDLFKRVIELHPETDQGYLDLGWAYVVQEKFTEAEDVFKKAIRLNPENDKGYGALFMLYKKKESVELMELYGKRANELRLLYYNPITRDSYLKLREILNRRKIKFVCMQYPMRNIEPLKKLFDSIQGIIFVDNERIFKDALKEAKYEDYFTDNFGGDFGHCTRKGKMLLAENVANVILKEIFNK